MARVLLASLLAIIVVRVSRSIYQRGKSIKTDDEHKEVNYQGFHEIFTEERAELVYDTVISYDPVTI